MLADMILLPSDDERTLRAVNESDGTIQGVKLWTGLSHEATRRRLASLFKRGLLVRTEGRAWHPSVYSLTDEGRALLRRRVANG